MRVVVLGFECGCIGDLIGECIPCDLVHRSIRRYRRVPIVIGSESNHKEEIREIIGVVAVIHIVVLAVVVGIWLW